MEHRTPDLLSVVSHDLRAPLTSILVTFRLLEDGVFGELPLGMEKRIFAVADSVSRLLVLVNKFDNWGEATQRNETARVGWEFFSKVCREMRIQLMDVMRESTMLLQGAYGNLPPETLPLMAAVEQSSDRLLGLINDLLCIDRLETGRIPMSIASISPERIMQQTASSLTGLAIAKRITVIIEAADAPQVIGDERRLVQVGTNLLSNALKFSRPGSTVVLSARRLLDFVEFRVQDSGCGIPVDQLSSLFEKHRAWCAGDGKNLSKRGLGLSICKEIVEQLSGEIGVSSQSGVGSEFYFRVPIDRVAARRGFSARSHYDSHSKEF